MSYQSKEEQVPEYVIVANETLTCRSIFGDVTNIYFVYKSA